MHSTQRAADFTGPSESSPKVLTIARRQRQRALACESRIDQQSTNDTSGRFSGHKRHQDRWQAVEVRNVGDSHERSFRKRSTNDVHHGVSDFANQTLALINARLVKECVRGIEGIADTQDLAPSDGHETSHGKSLAVIFALLANRLSDSVISDCVVVETVRRGHGWTLSCCPFHCFSVFRRVSVIIAEERQQQLRMNHKN